MNATPAEVANAAAPGLFGEVEESVPGKTVGTSRRVTGKNRSEGSYHADGYRNPSPAVANSGNVVNEMYDAEKVRQAVETLVTRRNVEYGDVIRAIVGGGAMGSKLAHESHAPFSEVLPEFFILSYCPPGGVVLDPHCGSSTTGAVAVRLGRRYLGCDVDPRVCEVSRARVGAETPPLFTEEGDGEVEADSGRRRPGADAGGAGTDGSAGPGVAPRRGV